MTVTTPSQHAADLRGLSHLAVDAVIGTTDQIEAVHAAVTHLSSAIGRRAPAKISELTGRVYGRVHAPIHCTSPKTIPNADSIFELRDGTVHEHSALNIHARFSVMGCSLDATGPVDLRPC